MHPEGGSWTAVRTHTPSKFSKVLKEPLAPIPLERSMFRENGSQPPPNRTCGFPRMSALRCDPAVSRSPSYEVPYTLVLRVWRRSTIAFRLAPSYCPW